MADLIFLALSVGFYAATVGIVYFFERLKEGP
jgi:hypothetical protein